MNSFQIEAVVTRKEQLSEDIYRLTFSAPQISDSAKPGQFLMIKTVESYDPLLRRPFSVHQTSSNGIFQILFKVLGKGTKYLSKFEIDQVVNVVGPLGRGFVLPEDHNPNICLIGGGMGIAPLYFLAKWILRSYSAHPIKVTALLGAASKNELSQLVDDFVEMGVEVFHATDDGSSGHHGFITDLIDVQLNLEKKWYVYSCGPHPMMKKIAIACDHKKWPCQVSLETMMACGISACLGCTVPKAESKLIGDARYVHVCKDGPVFDASDIAW